MGYPGEVVALVPRLERHCPTVEAMPSGCFLRSNASGVTELALAGHLPLRAGSGLRDARSRGTRPS